MQLGRCNECGATIGGLAHNPSAGNTVIGVEPDQTHQGYCVGQPGSVVYAGERGLTGLETTFFRTFVDAALVGTCAALESQVPAGSCT